MDTIDKVNGLDAAIRLIREVRISNGMASGAMAIFNMMAHAIEHLEAQVEELLKPTPQDALMADLKASLAETAKTAHGPTLVDTADAEARAEGWPSDWNRRAARQVL